MDYKVCSGSHGKTVEFKCPHCVAKLKSPLGKAGKSVNCPRCGGRILTPGETERQAEMDEAKEAAREKALKEAVAQEIKIERAVKAERSALADLEDGRTSQLAAAFTLQKLQTDALRGWFTHRLLPPMLAALILLGGYILHQERAKNALNNYHRARGIYLAGKAHDELVLRTRGPESRPAQDGLNEFFELNKFAEQTGMPTAAEVDEERSLLISR